MVHIPYTTRPLVKILENGSLALPVWVLNGDFSPPVEEKDS